MVGALPPLIYWNTENGILQDCRQCYPAVARFRPAIHQGRLAWPFCQSERSGESGLSRPFASLRVTNYDFPQQKRITVLAPQSSLLSPHSLVFSTISCSAFGS